MSYYNIKFEVEGPIATLSVNRPKVLNALSIETLQEMKEAVDLVSNDKNVRVLIVTGAKDEPAEGSKPRPSSFVAGADIAFMSTLEKDNPKVSVFVNAGQDLMTALENMDIPVIAAVDGFALGGGCELAISCDMIFATERSSFGQPEVKLGLIPGFGGTQRLPRLIGRNLAKELIYTGNIIKADRAKAIGLVNEIFPVEGFMDSVKKIADAIVACAPLAVNLSKKAINEGYHMELSDSMAVEVKHFLDSFSTEDRVEGTTAFVEKRPPAFKGK